MKKKLLILFCVLTALSGCRKQEPDEKPVHFVTEIRVVCENPSFRHSYSVPEKMGKILTSLRLLESKHPGRRQPLDITGANLKITLHFADGTRKQYRIQSDRYLCSDLRLWRAVDENQARALLKIIQEMPSDQSPQKGSGQSVHLPTRDLNCSS